MSDSESNSNTSDLDNIEDIELIMQLDQSLQQNQAESSRRTRKAINRERDVAEARLMADYFGEHPNIRTTILDVDIMSYQLVEMNNNVLKLQENISEKQTTVSELEECVCKKDLEIEKCLKRLNDYENKLYKAGQTRQTIHMIMPSKDEMYNGRKGIGFDNQSEKVIGLEYTLMFLTHSDEALEIEKFKRARENKIEFAYDYGNLNEKINFSDDYFQEIINPYFKKIDSPVQQT
ncbi:hypothetical protein Tco_0778810, partial [Tanacetum coccineum]